MSISTFLDMTPFLMFSESVSVIASMSMARKDMDTLHDLAWSCVIVDEVHSLKNPKSSTSIEFNRIQCPVRIGMSGTVVQNSYNELWTILDWTNPGAVGSLKQWKHYITEPLKRGQSASASEETRVKSLVCFHFSVFLVRYSFFVVLDRFESVEEQAVAAILFATDEGGHSRPVAQEVRSSCLLPLDKEAENRIQKVAGDAASSSNDQEGQGLRMRIAQKVRYISRRSVHNSDDAFTEQSIVALLSFLETCSVTCHC